ncbi:response regulator transcription factor [Streptomyces bryophytorum]|nr:response regulator transcription factor [Actinacidiphila bryophytorum]MBM9434745.1 response regulator transcription factor [Actinacidiphila bryophytorum]MBN6547882.1 response regulator transcription factor [Actinacidiphila bryophytorum]
MIRVLVAHDTSLLRSALAALLVREPDFEVSDTGWHGLSENGRLRGPQVCVVDADCPGWRRHTDEAAALSSGAARSAAEDSALIVLTNGGKPGNLRRAYTADALGFVNKDRSADRLPAAVRQVAQGKRFVDESLAVEFLQAADMPLTPRELSVLSLSAEGASVAEIARSLHLCNGTVRNYLAAITRKTGARNRVDAIRISRFAGWL